MAHSKQSELAIRLLDDLLSVSYHPTDVDACHLHEKHTPQCYGCRHAKWSRIIKEELKARFDVLVVTSEIEAYAEDRVNKVLSEILQKKTENGWYYIPVSAIESYMKGNLK